MIEHSPKKLEQIKMKCSKWPHFAVRLVYGKKWPKRHARSVRVCVRER